MRYTSLRALRIACDLFYPALLLFSVGSALLFFVLISSSIFLFLFPLLFFTRYPYSFYILRLFYAARAYSMRFTVVSFLYFLVRTPSFFRFSVSTTFFSVLAFSLFLSISPFSSAFTVESS
jgi:hypothetical protein